MKLGSVATLLALGLCQACSADISTADGGAGGVSATTTSSSVSQTSTTATTTATSSASTTVTGTGGAGGGELPDIVVNGQVLQRDLGFAIVDAESDPCLIGEGCLNGPGQRLVMQFSSRTENIGPVDFHIGDPTQSPNFVWSPCHQHYHYYDYAAYRLLDTGGNLVDTGHKQGFAVIDIGQIDPNDPNTPPFGKYGGGDQGIQHGWYDEYGAGLSCQWIDITDVPPGTYQLQVEVNPAHSFIESDYDNNTTTIPVTIPDCPLGCGFLDGDCTVGTCQPGVGCVAMPVNDGLQCDDFQYCTVDTTCSAGVCGGGSPRECAPVNGCYNGMCDEAADTCVLMPGNDGLACDDNDACTSSTTCSAGICGNGVAANEGGPCNDGASCTTGEFCTAGVCGGGTGPTIYFADDFSNNSNGWSVGPTWEIGPAQASVGAQVGDDPENDHSISNDDGIAGVVIGGVAPSNLHGYYYLESPAFDTSASEGALVLGFYRWLDSDFAPWMTNDVEVWTGTAWVTLWASNTTIADDPAHGGTGWTYQHFDISPFVSSQTKIRFGYKIEDVSGLFSVGSWNIDDVVVAQVQCP